VCTSPTANPSRGVRWFIDCCCCRTLLRLFLPFIVAGLLQPTIGSLIFVGLLGVYNNLEHREPHNPEHSSPKDRQFDRLPFVARL
jgi:hypothetical protein